MSAWITPSGTIGNYTQGQSLTFTLSASTTLGGTLSYVLANGSSLPSGLSLNSTTGVISGTPDYVSVNTITYFSVSATETSAGIEYPNVQAFSILITSTVWDTAAGSIGVFAENSAINYQFEVTPSQLSNTIIYSKLNGTFPTGTVSPVTLSSSGLLSGTPDSVTEITTYTFTIRAKEYNGPTLIGFKDRTFSITIDVSIPDPEFTTPSGTLFSALDSTWQSFQLQYIDQNPTSSIVISVVLGELPPGLEINSTGLIRGYPNPPVDGSGNPTTLTYSFTLEISSDNGSSLSSYDIIINNQELVPGFIGRAPTILNTQPLTFVISDTDPYKAYYLTSDNLGNFSENTEFIFKIIGHNFDGNDSDLSYIFNGPSIGPTYNSTTGWISGLLSPVGVNVITYNFTVSVYLTSQPTLISDTFFLSLTVVGDIDTNIGWYTGSNLGSIINGSISNLSVGAYSGEGVNLNYRIVGNEIQSNLKTLVNTGSQFNTFGDLGSFVIGTSNGLTWTSQPSINSPVSFLYFTSSVYDVVNQITILVGYNQTNSAIIGQLTDVGNVYTESAVVTANPLRKIIYATGIYVAVGDNGTITTTLSPDIWTTIETSGVTTNLNGICYSSGGFGTRYVTVGDQGVILTSPDTVTWTQQVSGTTLSLRSVIWTGTRYIIVGDLGIILISDDGITFTVPQIFNSTFNFKTITIDTGLSRIVAAGNDGIIIESFDDGTTWTEVQNFISTANLYDILYDVNTSSFYMVGDGGTVLVYNNDPLSAEYSQLSSPTLTQLPPDLQLLPTGEISGRLAFESTTAVVAQNTRRTYSFNVQAYSPLYSEINSIKSFTLTTIQTFYLPYDTVYIKALPPISDRDKLDLLLNDNTIIPPSYIYRKDDPYFGKSTDVIYDHIYGVPSVATTDFYTDYINAVQINHYWRNITLGEIKVAVGRNTVDGSVKYEVVYSEIQDNLVNANGESISKQIVWPRNINLHLNNWIDSLTSVYTSNTYYDTTPLVKTYLSGSGTTLVLNSVEDITVGMNITAVVNTTITNNIDSTPPTVVSIDPYTNSIEVSVAQTLTTNQQILFNDPVYTSLTPGIARTLYPNSLPNMREQIYDALGRINDQTLLPSWMTSLQPNGSILGFTPAWVICYVKPGYGNIVKNNIETLWPYTLNQIDFQLDRFEVDRSKTYNYEGVNIFGQPIWNTLPSAQPNVIGNSEDKYVYFPRKTILPDQTQE